MPGLFFPLAVFLIPPLRVQSIAFVVALSLIAVFDPLVFAFLCHLQGVLFLEEV
jgi:hypothetical protein